MVSPPFNANRFFAIRYTTIIEATYSMTLAIQHFDYNYSVNGKAIDKMNELLCVTNTVLFRAKRLYLMSNRLFFRHNN
jgi:hypothetical protein